MWAAVIILLGIVTAGGCQDRKLTTSLNPGSRYRNTDTTLVYTRSDGLHDTLHQLWDFTRGKPTVILTLTDTRTTLGVDWTDQRPRSFNWTNDPKYSFAVVINKIWQYNDLNDTAIWKPECETRVWDMEHIRWERKNLTYDQDEVKLRMQAVFHHPYDNDGLINIELDLLPFTDFASTLPHLMHSANSSLMEVSLVGLDSGGYNSSRFALELLLASTDPGSENMDKNMRKSLDDEHTPGIFEVVEITTPEVSKHGDGGFVQYRPIAYTAEYREVTASTIVELGRFNKTSTLPFGSTVERFFREYEQQDVLKESILVSFGGRGDGFYTKTNYTAWAFTVGYGSPPIEGFSMYVILVISIGLAIPAVLLLGGAVYMVVRRRRNTHQRLLS